MPRVRVRPSGRDSAARRVARRCADSRDASASGRTPSVIGDCSDAVASCQRQRTDACGPARSGRRATRRALLPASAPARSGPAAPTAPACRCSARSSSDSGLVAACRRRRNPSAPRALALQQRRRPCRRSRQRRISPAWPAAGRGWSAPARSCRRGCRRGRGGRGVAAGAAAGASSRVHDARLVGAVRRRRVAVVGDALRVLPLVDVAGSRARAGTGDDQAGHRCGRTSVAWRPPTGTGCGRIAAPRIDGDASRAPMRS